MTLFCRLSIGIILFASLVIAGLPAGAQSTMPSTQQSSPPDYVLDENGNRAMPFLVAKEVCAWPNITRLKDGTITAAIFNQPNHAMAVGDVECWASTDDGKTWSKRGVIAAHDPGELNNRMNLAAGMAKNGDLIVVVGGWVLKPSDAETGALELVKTRRPVVCRSSDGGFTWSVDPEGFPAASPDGDTYTPHGNIDVGEDGGLRIAAYTGRQGAKPRWRNSFILRSDDDGRTWATPRHLNPEKLYNETFILHLGGGKWIATARTNALDQYESSDDANTWHFVRPLTTKNLVPGHLMRLQDGRIMLSYGNRSPDAQGIDVRISSDEGKTWSKLYRILDWIGHDGGYPSSVQLPDGRMVTAFYARKMPYYDGYHMGVIIWSPTRTFGAP